jgi:hypothetical protein
MKQRKFRLFTIADYQEEEQWLREQSQKGWKFVKVGPFCDFQFESCEREDVIYRLEFKENKAGEDYLKMYEDFGWEYAGQCGNWQYFRKPADQADNEEEGQLFSNDESKAEMVGRVIKWRMLPLLLIFVAAVVPYTLRAIRQQDLSGLVFWLFLFVVYVLIFMHCGIKLLRMKRELKQK